MLNPDGDGTYVARMKLQDLIPQFLPIFGRITCQDDNGTIFVDMAPLYGNEQKEPQILKSRLLHIKKIKK